jgi:hypothetical protein
MYVHSQGASKHPRIVFAKAKGSPKGVRAAGRSQVSRPSDVTTGRECVCKFPANSLAHVWHGNSSGEDEDGGA